jgi:hypothetical protein
MSGTGSPFGVPFKAVRTAGFPSFPSRPSRGAPDFNGMDSVKTGTYHYHYAGGQLPPPEPFATGAI